MLDVLQPYMNVIVLGLIAIAVLVLAIFIYKSFNNRVRSRRGTRIGISEYYEVDKTRRLVLVRRDDVEHLVMIGGAQDLVVESNIPSAMGAGAPLPLPDMISSGGPPMRTTPRPAVFGGRRPPLRPVEPSFGPGNPQS